MRQPPTPPADDLRPSHLRAEIDRGRTVRLPSTRTLRERRVWPSCHSTPIRTRLRTGPPPLGGRAHLRLAPPVPPPARPLRTPRRDPQSRRRARRRPALGRRARDEDRRAADARGAPSPTPKRPPTPRTQARGWGCSRSGRSSSSTPSRTRPDGVRTGANRRGECCGRCGNLAAVPCLPRDGRVSFPRPCTTRRVLVRLRLR